MRFPKFNMKPRGRARGAESRRSRRRAFISGHSRGLLRRRIKLVLFALCLAGLAFFLLKDFVFREPSEIPFELGGAPAPARKIVVKKASAKEPAGRPAEKPAAPPYGGAALPAVSPKPALMAIILDDWGNNFSLVRDAVEIKRPLTLSILPHLPYSKRIAEEAFKNHLGVMLHMPMQPRNGNEPLEPHTILTTTPDETIRLYLDEAVSGVPHAEGVNNHMGSAATSDLRVMRTVLGHLKKKSLFFIDSYTGTQSVGPRVAKETGIPFTRRNVFIDNEPDGKAIRQRLLAARDAALKKGRVVVIGHSKRVTLRAIREVAPELEKAGIRFVLAKELVKKQGAT